MRIETGKYPETHPVLRAINAALYDAQERDGRGHLGASLIGRKCTRELWYTFRWATRPDFNGRMLRLFDRGHKEEFRFVEWLRATGAAVQEYETPNYVLALDHRERRYSIMTPEEWAAVPASALNYMENVTGQQHHEEVARHAKIEVPKPGQMRIVDCGGHFGGSLDGECQGLPGIEAFGLHPDAKGLLEFKTHSEASFKNLCKERVRVSKPYHYTQMQIYMFKRSLAFACYMAVNKNTDELYAEIVLPDPEHAREHIQKASYVIYSNRPPPRAGTSAASWDCKFCDHRGVCWFKQALQRNCRTCAHSVPYEGGKWGCSGWKAEIPKGADLKGCQHWTPIPND